MKRLCCAAALACVIGCGGSPSVRLSGGSSSAEELARSVIGAVERRDTAALQALALNEQEFREHVWPELPAARPERTLPFSYVWGDLRQKSEAGLALTIGRHGGRRYTLVSVRYDGEISRYPSYAVHRKTVLRVSDGTEAVVDLRLFGSAIQKDGVWKVFSYVVDE